MMNSLQCTGNRDVASRIAETNRGKMGTSSAVIRSRLSADHYIKTMIPTTTATKDSPPARVVVTTKESERESWRSSCSSSLSLESAFASSALATLRRKPVVDEKEGLTACVVVTIAVAQSPRKK